MNFIDEGSVGCVGSGRGSMASMKHKEKAGHHWVLLWTHPNVSTFLDVRDIRNYYLLLVVNICKFITCPYTFTQRNAKKVRRTQKARLGWSCSSSIASTAIIVYIIATLAIPE
jgi:hypothetical protein